MKCISCGGKNKGSPEDLGFRCPNCGHKVAASKNRDGLSDAAIKNAVGAVESSGQFSFLPEHVGYELVRRHARRRRRNRRTSLIFAAVFFILAFFFDWPFRFFLGLGGFIAVAAWFASSKGVPGELFRTVRRYLNHNPDPKLVEDGFATAFPPGDAEVELAAAARHLLVCQHGSYVDYLVANSFHLHLACPVVGPDPGLSPLFPGIVASLKARDRPSVLVLHDLTPSGIKFMQTVRGAPEWFGGHETATVLDLGLKPGQEELVPDLARPLDRIRGAGQGALESKLPAGTGVEVTAIRPGRFLRGLARSVAAGIPLMLPAAAAASGRQDSE